jgi:trehalose 6-phosphate synthase
VTRVVAVSNRVAEPVQGKSSGGLAVGVLAALAKTGGMWFGWNGKLGSGIYSEPDITEHGRITYATFGLNRAKFDEYYNGFCNNILWPVFHYTLGFLQYDRSQYHAYLQINALFARRLEPLLTKDDVIWVHDYHLIPLASELRQLGVDRPIGFFLHTPFPPYEVLRALPVHRELLRALCEYDVIGFQTKRDLRAFRDSIARRDVEGTPVPGGIRLRGRTIHAEVFPIGIDVRDCERMAVDSQRQKRIARVRASLGHRTLLLGADRLDYSKGLPERFGAYERLLEKHEQNRGHVVFMQVAPPTRTGVRAYTEIRKELERAAGHINGRFGEMDWVPLRYLNKDVDRATLMGLMRLARIGLVTPIRDGMNLVAKEYVAAQDPEQPGVLVLSTMAGAAQELDAAVLVNPYDMDGVAEGIQEGLHMSLDERRDRHAAMMKVLRRNDITAWHQRFVEALMSTRAGGSKRQGSAERPRAARVS